MTEKLKTRDKQRLFLDAFRKLGTVTHAAPAAQVDRRTVQRWRKNNKKFNAEYMAIKDEQDDQAYRLIHDAIQAGDIDAAKWLLTRPGRRFHDDRRKADITGKLQAEEQRQIMILEEAGSFLAKQMSDPAQRAELFARQEELEK